MAQILLNEKLTIMNYIQKEEIKGVKFLNDNSSRAEFTKMLLILKFKIGHKSLNSGSFTTTMKHTV